MTAASQIGYPVIVRAAFALGDRIEDRFDAKAERARAAGKDEKASRMETKGDRIDERLDNKGQQIDQRLDNKGARIDQRLDSKGQRINKRLDKRGERIDDRRDQRRAAGPR